MNCHLPRWIDRYGNCEHPDHTFTLDTPHDREYARYLLRQLSAASHEVPGWMAEASGLSDVLTRLDDAIWRYDERNNS